MSCKMSICESDAEPVTRLKDVGRQKPPKRPASRHVVNPNFMFFCQIVLLVIPISVLFAGLYFMFISSTLIILICGAIILMVLGIFVFVRPFKEEKCEEKKPLRRNYDYSPLKITTEADPVRTERPSDKHHGLHRDDDSDEEDDNECRSHIENASTDTLLSIGTGDLSLLEIATQGRTIPEVPEAGIVTPADWRCRCCQMGCRGPIARENEALLSQENLRQSKQSLPITVQDSDRCTWETNGYSVRTEQVSPPNSSGVIEEEGDTTRPDTLISTSLPSEENFNTAKLLIPDLALSDTPKPSTPTTNQTITNLRGNTSHSDNTQHKNQSQASDTRTMTGYTTQESSAMTKNKRAKSPPKSPRKTKSPQRFEQQTFTERPSYVSDQSDIENFRNKREKKGNSTGATCACRLSPFERNHKDNLISQPSPPISSTSTNLPQKVGQQYPKRRSQNINQTKNMPDKDETMHPMKVECTHKLCPFEAKNQPQPQMNSKMPFLPNSSFEKFPLKASPEKPVNSKKKRGFLEVSREEEDKLTTPGKQNIFQFGPQNDHPRKSVKDRDFQAVKFQICPNDKTSTKGRCSSADRNGTKQPILIKLFPKSSKDGVFSWEANPVEPNGIENTSGNDEQPIFPNTPLHSRTADECVQTTAPEMVDTQTSAVFSTTERRVRYNEPEVEDSMATKGNSMHHTTSGSMVDFVLRPFSKIVKSVTTGNKKSRTDKMKSSKRSTHIGNKQRSEQITETNNDPSKFDLLKIQIPNKKENHWAPENQREKEKKPKSPDNKGKSPRLERTAKLDICSIYYSSIQGKLYQPTRSGLLVTESSKEEVAKPQQAVEMRRTENAGVDKGLDKYKNKETSPRHHGRDNLEATQKQAATAETKRIRTKRKSDDERKSKPKCARHDAGGRQSKNVVSVETSLPWQKRTENIAKALACNDSELKDEITFMFPPFNLDFSSGPCDDESKISSSNPKCKQEYEKSACKNPSTDYSVPTKPQSPGRPHESKSKNQKTSHQVETTSSKRSSPYENVVIEKVIKQKKKTLKKFK